MKNNGRDVGEMDELSTRALSLQDTERLSEAFRAIGWSKPPAIFQQYLEEEGRGARWTRVAEWDGEAAGYVTIAWEPADPEFASRGIPEIMDLNVLPRFRNRGIGNALLAEAELKVSRRSSRVGIRVGLHPGYGAAQRLYVQRGYVPDGAGVVVNGLAPAEGSEIRLDDEATLRMIKRLPGASDECR